jgi:uncharacterized protein
MDQTEQQYIDALFDRIAGAERQSGPRDASAERYIRDIVSRQPNAPYYMAQALIVQEEALKAAQQRIEDLEREVEERPAQGSGGGSFLGGLFGGGSNPTRGTSVPANGSVPRAGGGFNVPRDGRQPAAESDVARYGQTGRGGGFLAGAMQTAVGVAGGVLLGNMLGDLFKGNEANATEAGKAEEQKAEDQKADAEQDRQEDQNGAFSNVEDHGGDFDGGGDYDI